MIDKYSQLTYDECEKTSYLIAMLDGEDEHNASVNGFRTYGWCNQ